MEKKKPKESGNWVYYTNDQKIDTKPEPSVKTQLEMLLAKTNFKIYLQGLEGVR